MESEKDIGAYQEEREFSDLDESHDEADEENEFEEGELEEEMQALDEEEQIFLQQQLQNQLMNAGEDESDDGLVLAGDGTVGSAYNQMLMADPNMDMNFQKMQALRQLSGWI